MRPSASTTGAALMRAPRRMSAAAQTVASAGTVTTGRVITFMAYMIRSCANEASPFVARDSLWRLAPDQSLPNRS
jgi:hypothetical protein